MAHRNTLCVYDSNHNLQIFHKNNLKESRNINVTITDFVEYVQIKLRDASYFVFNYTAHIDLRQFQVMRSEQSLDIEFGEFKSNLIDMLHQVQQHEMFLKCELDTNLAKLIFFGKSRIKSIIFLTINLQMTNQKEIFDEMNNNILELQSMNQNLVSQLQSSKTCLQAKDNEIASIVLMKSQLEKHFLKDLEKINHIFSTKLQECSTILLHKILLLTQRLLKVIQDVEVAKIESLARSEASARLLHNLESVRVENVQMTRTIDELKRENCNLKSFQLNNEKEINDLNQAILKQDEEYQELKTHRDEFEKDARQAALIIAQKTTTNEELSKDIFQANQMLVRLNSLLKAKTQETEDLRASLSQQDKMIQDHNHRFQELCREFEVYKQEYNLDRFNQLGQDVFAATRKLEAVEKVNRETAKLNELLTRKLAAGDFLHRHN